MRTKYLLAFTMAAASATAAMAQSSVDAYAITPTQLRGTARFVAMGGAFTSLGGDISTLGQNPAGIGIYRRNEIGLTFDVSARNYKTAALTEGSSQSETKCYFDNFGYIGSIRLDGPMSNFNWGVSYSRVNTFDRYSNGYAGRTETSLSNYIASYTNGVSSRDLSFDGRYNPYLDGGEDWLSILAYNSYMISNVGNDETYAGLFQNGSVGDALMQTHEWGYTDEYNIDFGGNVSDIVYWGIGVGIVDLQYNSESVYSEYISDAAVYDDATGGLVSGNADFDIYHSKTINASGANLKFGVILRPIDELRIGVAVHTPTWLHVNQYGQSYVDPFNYTPNGSVNTRSGSEDTPDYENIYRQNSPWRFMVGASTVLGGKAILSFDYERVAYNDMTIRTPSGNRLGTSYVSNEGFNQDIKEYFKAADIFRVGAEFRLSSHWSVRAGYNYQSSNVRNAAANGSMTIHTSGIDPSYTFNNSSRNISVGVGYRYKAWYLDATYQNVHQTADYHAFTNFAGLQAPSTSLTDNYNNFVISTGLKF